MRRRLPLVLVCGLCLVLLVSVVSAPRKSGSAPGPLLSGAEISPAVLAILQRSCADCHSEGTRYPWYSYVAPVSLLIARDVSEGRRHLNLSRWNGYPGQRRQRLLSEIANQVRDREMPLPMYIFMHGDARMSQSDIDSVFGWTQAERARLIEESAAGRR